jgi:hypothetical protein
MKVRQEWSGRQGALLHHRQSNEQREDKHGQEKVNLGVWRTAHDHLMVTGRERSNGAGFVKTGAPK